MLLCYRIVNFVLQVLHNLNMWCAKDKSLTYDEAKTDASRAKKDIRLVSVKYWIGFYCHILMESLGFISSFCTKALRA